MTKKQQELIMALCLSVRPGAWYEGGTSGEHRTLASLAKQGLLEVRGKRYRPKPHIRKAVTKIAKEAPS